MKNRSRGVTFIELLVGILIIGGFGFALSPFLKKASKREYRAKCASNLRRISVALYRYAEDHGDAFPQTANLKELTSALAGPNASYAEDLSVFVCPNTGHKKPSPEEAAGSDIDYMYVSGLRADSPPYAPIMADKVRGSAIAKSDNHGRGGVNVLYVNGDVKWLLKPPSGEWVKE